MQLHKETEITTLSRATFKVEIGWFISHRNNIILLQDPDKQISIHVVENQEKTAEQAVAAAWKIISPNNNYILKNKNVEIFHDGWDQELQFMYDVTEQKDQFIMALAKFHGTTWYVFLIEGITSAVHKRSAGLMLINSSLTVPGMQKESFAGIKAHQFDKNRLQKLTDFFEHARIACKIPGAAVAIVQDGNIILEQGFGVNNLETQQAVTSQTLFMVGSITKSLTTCMIAKLIDEGFFNWDTPVTQILPTFAVGDEQLTHRLTMIDMVSNANGIPQQSVENIFNYDDVSPESRITALKNVQPITKIGETFQYSNGMVSAGGYIAAHAVYPEMNFSQAYQSTMQKYLFDVVGMSASTFDFDQVHGMNHADPYKRDFHNNIVLTQEDTLFYEPKRPSGGAWSNVHDMGQYLLLQLNQGVNFQGKIIISEKNMLKRQEPQIKITDDVSYGLGLMIEQLHGITSINHAGGTQGFSSYMFFLPEYNVGCIFLTNLAGGSDLFLSASTRKIIELLFDGKPQAQKMIDEGIDQQKQILESQLKNIDFNPHHSWNSQFVGSYTNSQRGDLIIRRTEIGIELDARLWKSTLAAKKKSDGTFNLLLVDGPFAGLEFEFRENNGAMELIIDEGQQKQIFKRVE